MHQSFWRRLLIEPSVLIRTALLAKCRRCTASAWYSGKPWFPDAVVNCLQQGKKWHLQCRSRCTINRLRHQAHLYIYIGTLKLQPNGAIQFYYYYHYYLLAWDSKSFRGGSLSSCVVTWMKLLLCWRAQMWMSARPQACVLRSVRTRRVATNAVVMMAMSGTPQTTDVGQPVSWHHFLSLTYFVIMRFLCPCVLWCLVNFFPFLSSISQLIFITPNSISNAKKTHTMK